MKTKGAAQLVVILVVALLGGGTFLAFKPKVAHGESRRADKSEQTTEELLAALNHKSSVAAASVVKAGEVVSILPPSREKEFIGQELTIAGSLLEPANQQALIEAERRKNAVLSGQVEESRVLYREAYEKNDKLEKLVIKVVAAKRASDDELQETAALHLGAERTSNQYKLLAAALAALYFYTKWSHVSISSVADAAKGIREGEHPIAALDRITSRSQQLIASWIVHMKSKQ